MSETDDIVLRLEWSEQMQGEGLVDLQQDAIIEIKDQRGEVQYLRWCMDEAIGFINSGHMWDAENVLRVALGRPGIGSS